MATIGTVAMNGASTLLMLRVVEPFKKIVFFQAGITHKQD